MYKIKKDDLNEAISCYKNKEYRACALTIFSLIDNKLIITQKIRKDEVRIGNRAIDKLSNYNNDHFIKDHSYKYFVFRGLIECLKTYYENDKGFIRQYDLCNRNHLVHGRYTKRVTELDCIKLFNLLWGLYFVL